MLQCSPTMPMNPNAYPTVVIIASAIFITIFLKKKTYPNAKCH